MKKKVEDQKSSRATLPVQKSEKLDEAKPRDVKALAGMFGASNKSSAPAAQNPFKKSNTTLPKAEEKKTAEEPKKENPFTKVGAA